MGALHPRIVKVKHRTMSIYTPFSATETAPAFISNTRAAKDSGHSLEGGSVLHPVQNAATRGRCPESNKGEKKQKNSFWCFLFLPKLK